MWPRTVISEIRKDLDRIAGHTWVRDWTRTQPAPTGVVLLTGSAGMGKSHFLKFLAQEASDSGVAVLLLDGIYEGQTPTAFLQILESRGWIQRSGPRSEKFTATEHTYVKQIICIDHLDAWPGMQYWLRTVFAKELAPQNDLLVMACRDVHQETVCLGASEPPTVSVHLTSFPRQEAMERSDNLSAIAHTILAEASLPVVFPGIEALSILHEANQDEISAILEEPFPTNAYLALSLLSFIHRSAQGLAMEHGVSEILRDDFFNRSPKRFTTWLQRAIAILTERMTGCSWADKTHLLIHILHIQMKYAVPTNSRDVQNDNWFVTSDVHRLRPDVAKVTDGPVLHDLLERNAVSDGSPRFLSSEEQHKLLEAVLMASPEHVRVIREIHDRPVAMALCLPMDLARAVRLPEIIAKRIRTWSAPWLESDGRPSDCADSVLVPILAANPNGENAHPQDLWMALICSVFAMLSDAGPAVLLVNSGSVHSGVKSLLDDFNTTMGHGSGTTYTADIGTCFVLRHTGLRDWLHARFPSSPTQPALTMLPVKSTRLSEADIRDGLRHFHHTHYLTEFAKDRQLHVTGEALRDLILGFLITENPPLPLTKENQRLLRVSYIDRLGNAEAIANQLAIGRTTYYRQLAQAHQNFAESFTI